MADHGLKYDGCMYLQSVLKDPRALLKLACERLKGQQFDVIVVRGTSGLLLGSALAIRLRKRLAVVRKPNDSSHSSATVEGWLGGRWLFVDDLICSGSTFSRAATDYAAACAASGVTTENVGAYLYADPENGPLVTASECGRKWL